MEKNELFKRFNRLTTSIWLTNISFYLSLILFIVIFNYAGVKYNFNVLILVLANLIFLSLYVPLFFLLLKSNNKKRYSYKDQLDNNIIPFLFHLVDPDFKKPSKTNLSTINFKNNNCFPHYLSHDEMPIISCIVKEKVVDMALLSIKEYYFVRNNYKTKVKTQTTFKGYVQCTYLDNLPLDLQVDIISNKRIPVNYTSYIVDNDLSVIELGELSNFYNVFTNQKEKAKWLIEEVLYKYIKRALERGRNIEYIQIRDGMLYVFINEQIPFLHHKMKRITQKRFKTIYKDITTIFAEIHELSL